MDGLWNNVLVSRILSMFLAMNNQKKKQNCAINFEIFKSQNALATSQTQNKKKKKFKPKYGRDCFAVSSTLQFSPKNQKNNTTKKKTHQK